MLERAKSSILPNGNFFFGGGEFENAKFQKRKGRPSTAVFVIGLGL